MGSLAVNCLCSSERTLLDGLNVVSLPMLICVEMVDRECPNGMPTLSLPNSMYFLSCELVGNGSYV